MNTHHKPIQCDSRVPAMDARLLLTGAVLLVAWASLFAVTTLGSKVVLAVVALTYLFGCWKTRRGVLYLMPAIYIPYVWLVGLWPVGHLQSSWFATLWQLPGLPLTQAIVTTPGTSFELISSFATLLLFFACLAPARQSPPAALMTSGVITVLSLLNSLLCYRWISS